jgi:hypothetical protein
VNLTEAILGAQNLSFLFKNKKQPEKVGFVESNGCFVCLYCHKGYLQPARAEMCFATCLKNNLNSLNVVKLELLKQCLYPKPIQKMKTPLIRRQQQETKELTIEKRESITLKKKSENSKNFGKLSELNVDAIKSEIMSSSFSQNFEPLNMEDLSFEDLNLDANVENLTPETQDLSSETQDLSSETQELVSDNQNLVSDNQNLAQNDVSFPKINTTEEEKSEVSFPAMNPMVLQELEKQIEKINDASGKKSENLFRTEKQSPFRRADAKYICTVCEKKFFTKPDVEECFFSHPLAKD